MRASVKTLDGRIEGFSADDSSLSWHMFGGPMLATLPGDFSASDIAAMRLATLTVHGRQGDCWRGRATGVSHERIEGAGLNLALSMMRAREWPICLTKTDEYQSVDFSPRHTKPRRGHHRVKLKHGGWVRRKDDGQNSSIGVEPTANGVRFRFTKDTNYWAGSFAGSIVEIAPTDDATLTFSWSRYTQSHYRLRVYAGVPDDTRTDGDRWQWTKLWEITTSSGGTSGTATVHSTVDGCTAFLLYADTEDSIAPTDDRLTKVTNLKTYGTSITNPTPANIIGLALDEASPLVTTTYRDLDTSEGALRPFEATGTPLDLISSVLEVTGGRFMWVPFRLNGLIQWKPRYSLPDDDVYYEIDARNADTDFAGVDIADAATHCEVSYAALDGGTLTLERTTNAGFLGKQGVEKWISEDATHTTDATLAAHLGDVALAAAAFDRHAGSLTVESVKDANGIEVPLEHLECGRRARVRTLGSSVTPVLTEYRLEDGQAQLTLDDSPFALDIALANLNRR